MKFGLDSLNNILKKISDRELKYTDTIIIGDNSSGKSLLLKLLIEKAEEAEDIYFIDAVNRSFDASKVTNGSRKAEYKRTIVNTRIQEEYFNLKDSFNCYGTSTERIEEVYYWLEEDLQELFFLLTKERFQIIPNGVLGEVEFENGRGLLSSGYQAIVRIFLELLYYQKKYLVEKEKTRAMVIIDELDEFLSPRYAYKIFPFIKEKFPAMEFVVATHSVDLVAGAENSNLIILDASGYEVLDANDYQSITEVQMIFDRVFGEHRVQTSEIEETLRRLLNNKINKAWTEQSQQCLESLQKVNMTASQQLIYRQIIEW